MSKKEPWFPKTAKRADVVADATPEGEVIGITRKKLSKSSCGKYLQCAAAWNYHYNHNIKPIKTGSALVYGSGIDVGLNCLLLGQGDPMTEYDKVFAEVPVGKILPLINDYDGELLSDRTKDGLVQRFQTEFGYGGSDLDGLAATLLQRIKNGEELSENQYIAADLICRASLRAKAVLMFKAYEEQVLPQIESVVNVQKAAGGGFLDATVMWKGRGKVVIDHKTSGKAYSEEAVDYSLELTLYAADEQTNKAAYVVFLKQMKKNRAKVCKVCGHMGRGSHTTCDNGKGKARCGGEWTVTIAPECEIQIVHGEITPRAIEVAKEVQAQVQVAVDNKVFMCNFNQCNSMYGKQCEYKNLHWKGDMTGLEIKEKKK